MRKLASHLLILTLASALSNGAFAFDLLVSDNDDEQMVEYSVIRDSSGNINQRAIGIGKHNRFDDGASSRRNSRQPDVDSARNSVQTLQAFTAIRVNAPVSLTYTPSGQHRITLAGAADSVNALDIRVVRDTLIITQAHHHIGDTVEVQVNGQHLHRAEINGAASAILRQLNSASFTLQMLGAGDVTLSGRASRCEIDSQGVGDIDQSALRCKQLKVRATGASDIQVYVTEEISGTVAGAGDLRIEGNPTVRKLVTRGLFELAYDD